MSKGWLKNVWKLEFLGVYCVNVFDLCDEIDVNFVILRWLNLFYVWVKWFLSFDIVGFFLVK